MITETPAAELTTPAVVEEKEVSLQERLNEATPDEYKNWVKTGDIPPVKPKSEPPPTTETSAVSKESSATEKVETATVPETAKPQKKRDVDGRVAQLLKERKEADERWEARFKDLEGRLKPAEPSAKSESSSAADTKTETKASDKEPELYVTDATGQQVIGINPKTGKPFQTIAEWQKEHSAWLRAQITAEVDGKFTHTEKERQEKARIAKENESLASKLVVGKDKYADFEKVAFNPDLVLPNGSAADIFIRQSEQAADLLYYLGQHPEVLQGFYRYIPGKDDKPGALTGVFEQLIHPNLQMMELARIEARLAAGSTQPTPKSPVQTKVLPPPPTVLSANSSPAGDPVDEAIKIKDPQQRFAAYEAAMKSSERKARRA